MRIRTELVQIDVAVKDHKGNLVRDLTRQDFEVLEDGKPQPITHFAIGSANRPSPYLTAGPTGNRDNGGSKAAAPSANQGRYVVLAVDDFHLAAESLYAVKRTLSQFIENDLAVSDQVAMAATSGALGLYQPFTTDRASITRVIHRLSLQDRTGSRASGIPNITDYQAELIEQGDPGALQIALEEMKQRKGVTVPVFTGRTRASNASDPDESVVRAKARNIVAENAQYTVATLSFLESAIRNLRHLPGRKIMVLLSDGFFTGQTRNFSAYDLRRITDAATRAGVVIYSIDARGLVARPTLGSASEMQNSTVTRAPEARKRAVQGEIGAKQESLFVLAKDTGGVPFYNNNDLGAGLKRVLDDTEFYYVLGYEPTNTVHDGRFRKIDVRVIARPEVKIQTRAGYFAPAADSGDATAKKSEKAAKKPSREAEDAKLNRFRAALTSLTPLQGIPMEMAAHFLHAPPANSLALITARIDPSGFRVEQRESSRPPLLEVVGVILDESGKTVKTFSHSFALTRGEGPAPQNALNYHNVVPLGPGTYNVRLAVADGEMTRLGSASDSIDVPDFNEKSLQLSSIFLAEAGADLSDLYNALAATLQPAEAKNAKENSAEPAASPLQPARRFNVGSSLDFLLFAYQVQANAQGAGALSIQITIFSGGKKIYEAPPNEMPVSAEQAGHPVPCLARLPLATYEPGEYVLRIEVTDQNAKRTAARTIPFSIQ